MKLRLYNDSARFRLDMKDIEELHSTGIVTASIKFGFGSGRHFIYQVVLRDTDELDLELDGQILTLNIPVEQGREWIEGSDIGIYRTKRFGEDSLRIIVEKDMKCTDDTSEDQSNMFPNTKGS